MKRDVVDYFQELGFHVRCRRVPWVFGIYRVEAYNPRLS